MHLIPGLLFYHPVPGNKTYSIGDWVSRQAGVADYHFLRLHGINGPETLKVVFIKDATPKQKNRIGRTLAWEKMRRFKNPDG